MQKADTLIRTKVHLPFTRLELASRPRLQARITEGLRGPLTLITAPAGFGKTTLVASYIANCGWPIYILDYLLEKGLASLGDVPADMGEEASDAAPTTNVVGSSSSLCGKGPPVGRSFYISPESCLLAMTAGRDCAMLGTNTEQILAAA